METFASEYDARLYARDETAARAISHGCEEGEEEAWIVVLLDNGYGVVFAMPEARSQIVGCVVNGHDVTRY